MELQKESSSAGALPITTLRNLSSSSSAFVSACQTPFFSPRSPSTEIPERVKSGFGFLSNNYGGNLNGHGLTGQSDFLTNVKFVASNQSPAPNFYASSNLGTPETIYDNHGLVSSFDCVGNASSSSNNQGARNCSLDHRDKQKKLGRNQGKYSFSKPSVPVSSTNRSRSCDVYIGFHGRKPSLLKFANWLRAELEIHGISTFLSDRARCRNSRSHDSVERMMNACSYGVIILTKKSFGNPYSIEEIRHFLSKKNLVPIFFDLYSNDCLSRDIIERRGELWEKHGGKLWIVYGGLEKEWKEAIDGLSRVLDWKLEAHDFNWRDCILQAVILLGTRLGRSVVDRVNKWREQVEQEEFPFHRNEDFVGRKKELSELELILFGDVSGDGEKQYFELKTRRSRKSLVIKRSESFPQGENSKSQQSESSSKGKDPVIWKENEKDIEMQTIGSPLRAKNEVRKRRKRSTKILYGKGIACISGDSGIGKTELALEFAYRYCQRYKMVLWVGGESRYLRQNYLALRTFLEVDTSTENHSLEKGKIKCFEEQEEEAISRVRKEFMRDIPYLVVIDNLENENDWWDQRVLMDLLPRFGGVTHFIITTQLPRVMNLESMKLSSLSGGEALSLMKGIKDYPLVQIDALRAIEEKLGRTTLGLAIVGAILSELPITPSRLLETMNRMPVRDLFGTDQEVLILKQHNAIIQLLDVCLSIFDHADGPKSLASRMVQASGWFGPFPVPLPILALAAHKLSQKPQGSPFWKKWWHVLSHSFRASYIKRSEADAATMLLRFKIGKNNTKSDSVHFHEIIKLYGRHRGRVQAAQSVVQAVCLRGSISQCPYHLWAACFLILGFGTDPVIPELRPSELLFYIKRIALPLAVYTFITHSQCNAALELLRLSTEALEVTADSLVSRSEKWCQRPFCCIKPVPSSAQRTYLWQELALLRATVLETRAKLMLRGGQYDIGDDLIRKTIYIRSSICGVHHPDTVSARETLSKLTRLLTNVQVN